MMTATRPIQTRADLHGRNALVLGLARSGVAAARFLSDAGVVKPLTKQNPEKAKPKKKAQERAAAAAAASQAAAAAAGSEAGGSETAAEAPAA